MKSLTVFLSLFFTFVSQAHGEEAHSHRPAKFFCQASKQGETGRKTFRVESNGDDAHVARFEFEKVFLHLFMDENGLHLGAEFGGKRSPDTFVEVLSRDLVSLKLAYGNPEIGVTVTCMESK